MRQIIKQFTHVVFQIGAVLLLIGCGGGFKSTKYQSMVINSTGDLEIPLGKTCETPSDVGRVTMHRLNRSEYNNTVRDLFGVTSRPADSFPEDGFAEDFNNNADVLFLNFPLLEKYFEAAEQVTLQAFQVNRSSIMTCSSTSDSCIKSILTPLALKVFRRPASGGEIDRLMGVVQEARSLGASLDKGIQQALQAMLVSPHFLFRRVIHPSPDQASVKVSLNQYELASRLSYFLWSSTPDTELLNLAAQNQLKNPSVLKAQVKRMLNSPKSQTLIDNFSSQWLQLAKLDQSHPDSNKFPQFTEALKHDMVTETKMFMKNIFDEDLSLNDLVMANYTFANQRLINHYGINDSSSVQNFKKVSTADTNRKGILGQASILTLTSHPKDASIVHRGKWVLKNLLCNLPPPPPANIPPADMTMTETERSQQRMSNPACVGCHAVIDPIGTGLQTLDAIGQWRDQDDSGKALDGLGSFPDGRQFRGPKELASVIASDPRFKTCMVKKMLTYALGRELKNYDQCTVNKIAATSVGSQVPVSGLIESIVNSPLFQEQRGDGGQP